MGDPCKGDWPFLYWQRHHGSKFISVSSRRHQGGNEHIGIGNLRQGLKENQNRKSSIVVVVELARAVSNGSDGPKQTSLGFLPGNSKLENDAIHACEMELLCG